MYYDQLGGIKLSDQSADYSNALAQERRDLAGRQDDHVPPAHGRALVGRRAVHERRPAVDVQRRARRTRRTSCTAAVEALKSVSAPDADTFVLHLATRDSEFLEKLAIPILPAHVWSKYPVARLDKVDGPIPTVTTAPYAAHEVGEERHHDPDAQRAVRRRPQRRQAARRQAHPDHLLREPRLDLPRRQPGQPRLRLRRPDSWARAREARRQQERAARLLAARRLLGDRVQLVPADRLGRSAAGPAKGVKTAVVQDLAIRKALAYAIDREKLIPTVYEGQGSTAYGLISPRFKRYFVDRKNTPLGYAFDPAKAKADAEGGRLELRADAVHEERRQGRSSSCSRSPRAREFQRMAQRVKADAAQGRHRHRPRVHLGRRDQQPHLRERQEQGPLRAQLRRVPVGLGRQRHDADADHGGAAVGQRLERLVLRQQGLRRRADRRAHRERRGRRDRRRAQGRGGRARATCRTCRSCT